MGNNTYAERRADGSIAVRLHATDVLTFRRNGEVVLNSGGWFTVTTKDRINQFLRPPYRIASVKGKWTLWDFVQRKDLTLFADGMVIRPNGKIVGGRSLTTSAADERYNARIDKLITRYIKGLTPAKLATVMVQDGQGDCLFCRPFDFGDHDHLLSHLRERYYMPHLILNVIKSRKYRNPQFIYALWEDRASKHGQVPDDLPRMMRKFFRDRLYKGPRQGKVTGASAMVAPISAFA